TPRAAPRLRRPAWATPVFAAHVAVILFLCVLIVYPALILLDQSVRTDDGALTAGWDVQAYTSPRNYQAILNTIIIAAGTPSRSWPALSSPGRWCAPTCRGGVSSNWLR